VHRRIKSLPFSDSPFPRFLLSYLSAVILKLPLFNGVGELGPNHLSKIFFASPLFSISRRVLFTKSTKPFSPFFMPRPYGSSEIWMSGISYCSLVGCLAEEICQDRLVRRYSKDLSLLEREQCLGIVVEGKYRCLWQRLCRVLLRS